MIAIKHMLPINTKHNKPIVEAPSIKALCANDKIIPIKPITITGINVENITEANLEKNNVLLLTGKLPNKSTHLLLCMYENAIKDITIEYPIAIAANKVDGISTHKSAFCLHTHYAAHLQVCW